MSEAASLDDARWLRERDRMKRVKRHTLMECMMAMSENGSKRDGPLAKTVRSADQSRKMVARARANGSRDQQVAELAPRCGSLRAAPGVARGMRREVALRPN